MAPFQDAIAGLQAATKADALAKADPSQAMPAALAYSQAKALVGEHACGMALCIRHHSFSGVCSPIAGVCHQARPTPSSSEYIQYYTDTLPTWRHTMVAEGSGGGVP